MNGRYVVKSLGCKANHYDAQLIEAELRRRGWQPLPPQMKKEESPSSAESDSTLDFPGPVLCIVNSCTVTDEADRQSRRLAARLSRDNPEAYVVVTGCAAEVDPERLAASRGIDYVIGNIDKPRLVEIVLNRLAQRDATSKASGGEVLGAARGYDEILSRHPMDREWPLPELPGPVEGGESAPPPARAMTATTRAFLKIQEGCNSFCTYCIIPYGRGPARSLRPREILEAVRTLVGQGIREIVLTGTNLGDYGSDWGGGEPRDDFAGTIRDGLAAPIHDEFTRLVARILSDTSLERLRLSSLDPTEITPALMALMSREPRLCPHFHVSLQSPHSRVLRAMKRRYGFSEVKDCLEKTAALPIAGGGAFIGMDIITGFPGETEDEFAWGVERLRELPWTRLHVFPYSERAGTPATRLPGTVPHEVRTRRARTLSELSFERLLNHHEKLLESLRATPLDGILLERAPRPPAGLPGQASWEDLGYHGHWAVGYTPQYIRVFTPVPSPDTFRNQIVSVSPEHLISDRVNSDVAFVGRLVDQSCS